MEFPDDRKDISDYFGLDDFLLRVHVTSGLQYAFDDQAVGADKKKLGVMKSSFLKFFCTSDYTSSLLCCI